MYSCNDDTTNPGPSAWLTEWAYLSPNLSQIHDIRQMTVPFVRDAHERQVTITKLLP